MIPYPVQILIVAGLGFGSGFYLGRALALGWVMRLLDSCPGFTVQAPAPNAPKGGKS